MDARDSFVRQPLRPVGQPAPRAPLFGEELFRRQALETELARGRDVVARLGPRVECLYAGAAAAGVAIPGVSSFEPVPPPFPGAAMVARAVHSRVAARPALLKAIQVAVFRFEDYRRALERAATAIAGGPPPAGLLEDLRRRAYYLTSIGAPFHDEPALAQLFPPPADAVAAPGVVSTGAGSPGAWSPGVAVRGVAAPASPRLAGPASAPPAVRAPAPGPTRPTPTSPPQAPTTAIGRARALHARLSPARLGIDAVVAAIKGGPGAGTANPRTRALAARLEADERALGLLLDVRAAIAALGPAIAEAEAGADPAALAAACERAATLSWQARREPLLATLLEAAR